MDNAVCLGGVQIVVDKEYWRIDSNSTDISKCPRPSS